MVELRSRRRLQTAALAVLASAPIGCGLVAGLSLPDFVDPRPDAGGDVVRAGPIDPCHPRLPPLPADPGGADLSGRITFAVQYVALGDIQPDGGGTLSSVPPDVTRLCSDPSIDLDNLDTCGSGDPTQASCTPRGKKDPTCDKKGGGDNAGAAILNVYQGLQPDPADDPNPPILEGRAGLLFDVGGYNGKDDDPTVAVNMVVAAGLLYKDGGLGAKPQFDSTDVWAGETRAFNGTNPRYAATTAYVSGGVLVARFVDTPFDFGGSGANLLARELVVTARVVRNEQGVPARLDQGRVGARIDVTTILGYAGGRLANGMPLCDGPGAIALVSLACRAADLFGDYRNTDTTEKCDAVSYAVGFYAMRALRDDRSHASPYDGGAPRTCPVKDWPPTCDGAGVK